MSRWPAKLLAFALLTLAVALPLEACLNARQRDPADRKYAELFGGPDPHNALVMGSSRAAYGIDPAYLDRPGVRFFNAAFDGSGPIFQLPWYKLYRATGKRPALVLIGLDWYGLGAGLGRRVEHDAGRLPWATYGGMLRDHTFSRSLLLTNRLALVRDREALQAELVGLPHASGYERLPARYHDGFTPLAAGRFVEVRADAAARQEILPDALRDFRTLIALMRADGVRLVLAVPPNYAARAVDHHADLDALVRAGGVADLPLVEVAGAAGAALAADRANFIDRSHLNERGSAAFSKLLADELARRGLLRVDP